MQFRLLLVCLLAAATYLLVSCAGDPAPPSGVRSVVQGAFDQKPGSDSLSASAPLELLVVAPGSAGALDTLGAASTQWGERFTMVVEAREAGVYPLVVRQQNMLVGRGQLVVADGDTASIETTLPSATSLRARSVQNASWYAYRNTKAGHVSRLRRALQGEVDATPVMREQALLTGRMLWQLHEQYPETVGGQIAAADAISMVSGWSDSLAIQWTNTLPADHPNIHLAARPARRALMRSGGAEAALRFLDSLAAEATVAERKAALRAEAAQMLVEQERIDEAREVVDELQSDYADTPWGDWAERALYEMEHLMPGMEAPEANFTLGDGTSLRLDQLEGAPLVVGFLSPQELRSATLQEQIGALARAAETDSLRVLAVVVGGASGDAQRIAGRLAVADGLDAPEVQAFNVTRMPTWYGIDAEGRIVGKRVDGPVEPLLVELAGSNQPAQASSGR